MMEPLPKSGGATGPEKLPKEENNQTKKDKNKKTKNKKNGNTEKLKIHPLTVRPRDTALPPELQTTLRSALIEQDSIPTLSSAIHDAFTESGYLKNLDDFIDKALTSGEYGPLNDPQTIEKILVKVKEGVAKLREDMLGEGNKAKNETGDLRELNRHKRGLEVPKAAVDKVLPALVKEVEKCVEVVEDD